VKQLQTSSELDAMYAGGLSLFNIFKPIFVVGILLSLLLLWLTMIVVPEGKLSLYNTSQKLSSFQAEPSFTPQQFSNMEDITFYSEGRMADGSYSNVLISDARESSINPTIYIAKAAYISRIESGLAIQLKHGNQVSGAKDTLNLTNFDEYIVQIPLAFEGSFNKKNADTEFLYMHGSSLYNQIDYGDVKSIAEWNKRWVLALVIVILFFIAIPLALQAKRSQKGGSFIFALILLAMIDQSQYIVFVKVGAAALPIWSSWVLIVLYAMVAVFLFAQVNKYGSLSLKRMLPFLEKRKKVA